MLNDNQYLFEEIKRNLFLALMDCRKKGKELINKALEDIEKLKKRLNIKDN